MTSQPMTPAEALDLGWGKHWLTIGRDERERAIDGMTKVLRHINPSLAALTQRVAELEAHRRSHRRTGAESMTRCDACRWWLPVEGKAHALLGECRRAPPTFADNIADPRVWPYTRRADWCGEFATTEPQP